MQYRKDQKSGNNLSVLGLGCMRLPRNSKGSDDMGKAERLICDAIEMGVNYFDTAYLYGKSEEILGAALTKSGQRENIFLATKLPHQKCKTYEDFDRFFNEQLAHLQTDYFDYYLIHNLSSMDSFDRLLDLGIESWIAKQKTAGRIRQIGFSFHGSQHMFMELLDRFDWDFCQIQYNYMDENYQAGRKGLQRAYEKGLAVIVMEPLFGGKLATGLPKQAIKLFNEADSSRTPVAWALEWLWDQPEVTVVISGMSTKEQLDENVETAGKASVGMLTEQDKATIAEVVEVFHSAYKVDCSGCNYCMPCPQGINIPSCFAAYNARYVTGYVSGITLYVTSLVTSQPGKQIGPGSCIECGACEKLCPQHIPITEELKAVKKKMEPFFLGAALKIYWMMNGGRSRSPEPESQEEKDPSPAAQDDRSGRSG
ncbi:MAG: aldo/keto reductase [Coriobacteriales bacterium]|jgi:predicted aldo/keto reductase-like oxidoreductase|nr:aldo/keto reductase [Coriobacteriales bacterium]